MGVLLFIFAQLSPNARQKILVKPMMKRDFSIKWHLRAIQSQTSLEALESQ